MFPVVWHAVVNVFAIFSLSELEDMEYRKVIVRGKFDHSKELNVIPRSLLPGTHPNEDSSSTSTKFTRPPPKSGAHVITAFELSSHQHPKCVFFIYCHIVL